MAVVERVKRLTPRRQRWERLLRSLDFQVEAGTELEPTSEQDFIICGLPRGGTSLLAAALYQPPTCVTVMEPWDGLRMPPADLFRSLREEVRTGMLRRGRLDVGSLKATGHVRWGRDGAFPHAVGAAEDALLGVKWPVFWRYLDLLPTTRFLVCIRHPVELIESFARTGGRLAEGLEYHAAFNCDMNAELRDATDDPRIRRALLFEHVASRVAGHLEDPNVLVVRYERWFTDRGGLMREVGGFLGEELGSGWPVIRTPGDVRHDPSTARLVQRYCPSAAALGYDVAARTAP